MENQQENITNYLKEFFENKKDEKTKEVFVEFTGEEIGVTVES